MARCFIECCEMFEHHFIVHGYDVSDHARHYLSGLLGTQRRKNMERIEADVSESNYQGIQQFISDSPWDHRAVMAQVATQAEQCLGGHSDTALYLDETSFVKKGQHSVGVQRQYCGRLGKLENCQVGVFASLGCGERTALVDFRLFLPQAWVDDPARCEKAKVPEAEQVHRTKTQLALEMVIAARDRGSTHQWIGGDEVYGNNHAFTTQLDRLGEVFVMDVANTLRVWEKDPCPQVPAAGKRGRRSRRARATSGEKAVTVRELVRRCFESQARTMTVRETTQGDLRGRIWACRVWVWDGIEEKAAARWLIARKEADGSFKYTLSNASEKTSWKRLAFMQAQRFWIERGFQDAKSELGMAHYEVRGWPGWHHHMTLVCLALLFVLQEREHAKEDWPLLSARDIVELLAIYLPRRPRNEAEVLAQMHKRHAARQRDIDRRRKRPLPPSKTAATKLTK